ncbi:MAG TPA: DCC1-like thiol-disulfide oxidoreductase family protein [Thermoleophilaceae bacterium]|nr:DCC1-like thiol-disulfide oxidoreductase family protein [Thermoleophilaceae bacterium]
MSTPAGVNDEFRPFLRMTFPESVTSLDPETVPIGERICRSWILLFGVLPVDWDDIVLVAVEPGRGFRERSSMATQHVWEHERTLEPAGRGACRVSDTVAWEPRLHVPAAAFRPLFRAAFAWRHHRLRRIFGRASVTVLYDSDCGFCKWSLSLVLRLDRRRLLRPLPLDSPEARALTPALGEEERFASAHAVTADGRVGSGGAAIPLVADVLPAGAPLAALARRFPGAAERAYRAVADRRAALSRLVG